MKAPTNFKQLTRQPTGTHFLDSGGTNGRHWQRPPAPDRLLSLDDVDVERGHFSATIHVGTFLDNVLDIDRDMRRAFKRFAARKDQQDKSWWETIDSFMESRGYKQVCGDNAYNWENDLDQVFCFHVYMPEGSDRDWLYNDAAVVWVATHNGADVRGGYSEPLPVRPKGHDGFTSMLDVVVGWSFQSGTDDDGTALSQDELQRLDEHYQVGYASNPTYELRREVEEILGFDIEGQTVTLLLKTGETVVAYPNCRAE